MELLLLLLVFRRVVAAVLRGAIVGVVADVIVAAVVVVVHTGNETVREHRQRVQLIGRLERRVMNHVAAARLLVHFRVPLAFVGSREAAAARFT